MIRFLELLKIFGALLVIGMACSLFPWSLYGVIFGFPAVVLNSLILTIIYLQLRPKDK